MSASNDGLLQKWLEQSANAGTAGPGTPDPAQRAKEITDKLKNDFQDAWDKLKTSLSKGEASEITKLCHKQVKWNTDPRPGGNESFEREYKKDLCAGLMGIRYFMSGITELGGNTRDAKIEENLPEDKWFARCTVGMLALSEIYGDHCKLNEVIEQISDRVEWTLAQRLKGHMYMMKKCEGKVDAIDLFIGRTILQDQIRNWAEGKRASGTRSGAWRVGTLWGNRWKQVCNGGKGTTKMEDERKKENLKTNASSMTKLMKLDSIPAGSSHAVSIGDILVDTDNKYATKEDTLRQVFQDVMQNDSSGPLNIGQVMEKLKKETETTTGKYYIMNILHH
ncbi:SICAvar, type I (fragment) [Plasmodium knowlesi strain H]|uniref:SICAvar, type I n=1 Tax=Plasmodium knowlesi (strain H) TaxID=5851 RepID=A0A1A7VUT4_PLAKH